MLSEQRKDRLAALIIRCGGTLVILVVVAIVLNISLESLPLLMPVRLGPVEPVHLAAAGPDRLPMLIGSDPRRERLWWLDQNGDVHQAAALPGAGGDAAPRSDQAPLATLEGGRLVAADQEIGGVVALLEAAAPTRPALLRVGRVRALDRWQHEHRTSQLRWQPLAEPLELDPDLAWTGVSAAADELGRVLAAAWTAAGRLQTAEWDPELERWHTLAEAGHDGVSRVALASDLRALALVDRGGRLHVLEVPSMQEVAAEQGEEPAAELRFLVGGGSLVVAGTSGQVGVWLRVPYAEIRNQGTETITIDGRSIGPGGSAVLPDDELGRRLAWRGDVRVATVPPHWQCVRRLPAMPAAPTAIAASDRRRCLLIGAADGSVGLYHSTSGRRLALSRWTSGPIRMLSFDPKGDGAVAGGPLGAVRRTIDSPHPEVSLSTLLAPVWYEGYAAPRRVWQSTGGTDSFEPKLSLWPLLFGTLKATLYAMLVSVPLALAAALYVSQMAPPWLQTVVKPTVELMAAVPSVIIGFLAALWLAPRVEAALLETLLSTAALPVIAVVGMLSWRLVPPTWRRRIPAGGELVMLVVVAVLMLGLVWWLAGVLETRLFDGDLARWLFTEHGIRYDQRNGMVVGIALGFAVIPVIFTLAEDACSSVPGSLIAASRALGATRWQTATRLVVPAASPGLFAAVMLGFGRAVGETMIVLMAAGNTPLVDLSPFDGMRTMSAAIAIEIQEAPVGGTLYRVLFLTGTLLFLLTLVVTTAADLVSRALRKRYGRLEA